MNLFAFLIFRSDNVQPEATINEGTKTSAKKSNELPWLELPPKSKPEAEPTFNDTGDNEAAEATDPADTGPDPLPRVESPGGRGKSNAPIDLTGINDVALPKPSTRRTQGLLVDSVVNPPHARPLVRPQTQTPALQEPQQSRAHVAPLKVKVSYGISQDCLKF